MKLSRHFIERWKLRVSNGVEPKIDAVKSVLAGSIRVQKGEVFTLISGARYKTLSLYWNPDLKIIIRMDPETQEAVSVATDTMADGNDKKRRMTAKRLQLQRSV